MIQMKQLTQLKNKLMFLFTTHIGRLLFASLLVIIGGSISNFTESRLPIFIMNIGVVILVVYFIIMMYYAIKNTISDFKNK